MEKVHQDKSRRVNLDSQHNSYGQNTAAHRVTHCGMIHHYLRPVRKANEQGKQGKYKKRQII